MKLAHTHKLSYQYMIMQIKGKLFIFRQQIYDCLKLKREIPIFGRLAFALEIFRELSRVFNASQARL